MNIQNNFDESLDFISLFNGVTLNLEERLKLEISLNDLQMNIQSEEILFWGKIIGVEKDYYIAVALFYKEKSEFPRKVFYFCSSTTYVFSLLPEVQDYHIKLAANCNTYFIGNPETILEYIQEDVESFNPNSFEDIYKKASVKKNFTEADRLSYVVRNIEFDCSIVPVGAYKMIPIGEIRPNDNFSGLKEEELESLRSYMHFRPALTEDKKELIKRGESILNFNFLDDLSQDTQKSKSYYNNILFILTINL